jgi:hypothetical protein
MISRPECPHVKLIPCILILVMLAVSASGARTGVGVLLGQISPAAPGGEAGVAGILWGVAADESIATAFLDSVDSRQILLADTLLAVLRMAEPELRGLLPRLYVISDFGPPPGERDPAWADIRWAGIRWFRKILDFGPEGRDRRVREDLDAAMARVDIPQRAEMGGLVEILVEWWADRGLDPALTHHLEPRDPAARALEAASALPTDAEPYPGLNLLMAMDADPVIRERVLGRLSLDDTAWLVRDLVLVVEADADSLSSLGVPARRWDPAAGVGTGHDTIVLRRLALQALDQTAPFVSSGADDLTRRLARLKWWDAAKFEARYWSDPREAPDFAIFLLGLRKPVPEGGRELTRWVRLIHLQPRVLQEHILEQLGPEQEPVVAELMGLAALSRADAAQAGFRMVYTRRPITRSEGPRAVSVAINWETVQILMREMLSAITGVQSPAVLRSAPESLSAWWADWWATERDDPRWYRGELPALLELPPSEPGLDLSPQRGRVDLRPWDCAGVGP